MTALLEKAFKRASMLSDQQQDAIAKWLLLELESENRWEQSFTISSSLLNSLATKALVEKEAGNALLLDPEKL